MEHRPARRSSSNTLALALALALPATACGPSGPLMRQAAELNSRGAAALARGDLESARASFDLALEYNQRYAEPHNNLGLVSLARGHIREARVHFRAAISRNPDFAEAWSNLGVALSHRMDDADREATPAAAAHAFRQALSIDPGLIEARANLVRALLLHGDLRDALDQARRLTQIAQRSALAHALRAEAAMRVGRTDEAEEQASMARAMDSNDPGARLVLARIAMARGEVDEARALLERLAWVNETAVEAHALLAALDLAGGDAEGARRELAFLDGDGAQNPVARVVRAALEREGR